MLEAGSLAKERKDNRLLVREWGEREPTKGRDNRSGIVSWSPSAQGLMVYIPPGSVPNT